MNLRRNTHTSRKISLASKRRYLQSGLLLEETSFRPQQMQQWWLVVIVVGVVVADLVLGMTTVVVLHRCVRVGESEWERVPVFHRLSYAHTTQQTDRLLASCVYGLADWLTGLARCFSHTTFRTSHSQRAANYTWARPEQYLLVSQIVRRHSPLQTVEFKSSSQRVLERIVEFLFNNRMKKTQKEKTTEEESKK